MKAWWGGAPVVPATIPEWDAESLGHYFFSDSNIVKTAAAPPPTAAVIPEPEKLAADRGLLTGAVSALTRAVVFDGVKAGDHALDPFLDLLTPAVEKEIEYATANNSYSNGPLYHFDVFPLFYATLAVVGHEDTLTALLPVLARHFDVALTGIGVTTLTGVQITEALFRALLEDHPVRRPRRRGPPGAAKAGEDPRHRAHATGTEHASRPGRRVPCRSRGARGTRGGMPDQREVHTGHVTTTDQEQLRMTFDSAARLYHEARPEHRTRYPTSSSR